MTNSERIDNCVTNLIETISKNISSMYGEGSIKQCDEIEALASLVKAHSVTDIIKIISTIGEKVNE